MTDTAQDEAPKVEPELILITDFFESVPPNQVTHIQELTETVFYSSVPYDRLKVPELQLHCPEDSCNGLRFFRCKSSQKESPVVNEGSFSFFYVTYSCSNCQKHERIYSIAARKNDDDDGGIAYKFGELPPYGPPTSAKLIKLIGPDRDTFLKGRRCENQGLGIGAFIYYRRVVENQKNRVFAEVKKVAEKVGASQVALTALDSAMAETQFSKALDLAKEGIPESLLINGHNPMKLLHSALSDGVHARTDEECMEIATSVRIVLGDLADRLGQALKEEAELRHALATLMKTKA